MPHGMYGTAQSYRALLVLGSAALLAPITTVTLFWFLSIALPPGHATQPYIQAAETQQLKAEQNYCLTWYGKQVYAHGKHIMALAVVLR